MMPAERDLETAPDLDPDAWATGGPDPWRALAADVILSAVRLAASRPEEMVLSETRRRRLIYLREKEVRWLQSRELLRWLHLAGYEPREIPAVADLVRGYAENPGRTCRAHRRR